MKVNPILDAIRESYYRHGLETERAVFSMIMTKAVRDNINIDLDNLNLLEIMKTIHNQQSHNHCINFREGELTFQENYEIHSVSASKDDEGDPEVFIHMLDNQAMETHSVRVSKFPNLDWLLTIVEAVNNKCELSFNIDEDEED